MPWPSQAKRTFPAGHLSPSLYTKAANDDGRHDARNDASALRMSEQLNEESHLSPYVTYVSERSVRRNLTEETAMEPQSKGLACRECLGCPRCLRCPSLSQSLSPQLCNISLPSSAHHGPLISCRRATLAVTSSADFLRTAEFLNYHLEPSSQASLNSSACSTDFPAHTAACGHATNSRASGRFGSGRQRSSA